MYKTELTKVAEQYREKTLRLHKTDLDYNQLLKNKRNLSLQILQYFSPLESGNLQLEQTKLPVFFLCLGKFSKFPVFSLTGNLPSLPFRF